MAPDVTRRFRAGPSFAASFSAAALIFTGVHCDYAKLRVPDATPVDGDTMESPVCETPAATACDAGAISKADAALLAGTAGTWTINRRMLGNGCYPDQFAPGDEQTSYAALDPADGCVTIPVAFAGFEAVTLAPANGRLTACEPVDPKSAGVGEKFTDLYLNGGELHGVLRASLRDGDGAICVVEIGLLARPVTAAPIEARE